MNPDLIAERERELAAIAGLEPTANNIARAGVSPWAWTQMDLRRRALERFPFAADWWWERDGLAMASSPLCAAHHAAQFPDGVEVWDVGCGVGVDLVAIAGRGPVVGWEVDAERAMCAAYNLLQSGQRGEVRHASAPDDLAGQWLFLDPMRRGSRGRVGPEDYSPNPWTMPLAQAAGYVIKLSPMVADDRLAELGGVAFLSCGGDCPEACVTSSGTGFRAVHLESGAILERTAPPEPSALQDVILEADPAAVRAHATGHFRAGQLGDHPGFLTGHEAEPSPWYQRFAVIEAVNPKAFRGKVSRVKTRGNTPDANALHAKLGYDPAGPVLMVWAENRSVKGALCQRIKE